MLERILGFTLLLGVLAQGLFVGKFIGDHMLAGLPKSEAVVMALGYLAPVSWVFLAGLYFLEVWKNRQLRNRT